MPLNTTCRDRLLKIIDSNFKTEIQYYTHPKVQTTAHAVGTVDAENWTQLLHEEKIIPSLPTKGDRFVEIERTLTAFYCLLLQDSALNDAYDAFSAAQKNNPELKETDVITENNFKALQDRTRSIINSDSDKHAVLMYLIIYSDLGKSPRLKELLSALANDNNVEIDLSLDPDDLMAAILKKFTDEQIGELLPSYLKLSLNAKEMLKRIYPIMQACFGHLYFLERGERTLQIIAAALKNIISPKQRKEALDIVYLAQLYDGIGAQGQKKITGSVTCTNHFSQGYDLIYSCLGHLLTSSSKQAFDYYLHERAKWLGLDQPLLSREQQVIIRLACMLRGFTPDFGAILIDEFKKLNLLHQELLIEQFGFNGEGIECWTKVNYIATVPQNLSRELFANNQIQQAVAHALNGTICFAMLVKEMTSRFPEIVIDETRAISFGEIAFLATQHPELFDPNKFNAAKYAIDPKQNKIVQSVLSNNHLAKTALMTGVGLAGLYVIGCLFFKKAGAPSPADSVNTLKNFSL